MVYNSPANKSRFVLVGNRAFTRDPVIFAGFFVATLLLRIPYFSEYLYDWDSVGFALGLERFNLAEHQPHPPGYLLYLWLGHLVNFFVSDAHDALVAISIISSAAAVGGIYLLGHYLFNRTTGMVAAALLLFSPLDWFYGEIVFSYQMGLAIMILVTWLLYRLILERRDAVACALVMGMAGGFRTSILVFYLPFFLFGTLRLGGAWGITCLNTHATSSATTGTRHSSGFMITSRTSTAATSISAFPRGL